MSVLDPHPMKSKRKTHSTWGLKKWQKKFSAEFIAKVAIEALKGHKTNNELATEWN